MIEGGSVSDRRPSSSIWLAMASGWTLILSLSEEADAAVAMQTKKRHAARGGEESFAMVVSSLGVVRWRSRAAQKE